MQLTGKGLGFLFSGCILGVIGIYVLVKYGIASAPILLIAAVLFFLAFAFGRAPANESVTVNQNDFIEQNSGSKTIKAEPINAESQEKAFPYEILKYRVAGVTFTENGIDRQYVLRHMYYTNIPFNKGYDVIIQKEVFEDNDAVGVYVVYVGKDEEYYALKLGYIPKESVGEVVSRLVRFDRVSNLDVYGGNNKNWGAAIFLRFWKEGLEGEINDLDYKQVHFEREKGRRFS